MSADAKRHYGSLALFALGVLAFCGGPDWLLLLTPAAALVWYVASPKLHRGRN